MTSVLNGRIKLLLNYYLQQVIWNHQGILNEATNSICHPSSFIASYRSINFFNLSACLFFHTYVLPEQPHLTRCHSVIFYTGSQSQCSWTRVFEGACMFLHSFAKFICNIHLQHSFATKAPHTILAQKIGALRIDSRVRSKIVNAPTHAPTCTAS